MINFKENDLKSINVKAEAFKIFLWSLFALLNFFFFHYLVDINNRFPYPEYGKGFEERYDLWLSNIIGYPFSDYLLQKLPYLLLGAFVCGLSAWVCYRFYRKIILTIQMIFALLMGGSIVVLLDVFSISKLGSYVYSRDDSFDYLLFYFCFFVVLTFFVSWRVNKRLPEMKKELAHQFADKTGVSIEQAEKTLQERSERQSMVFDKYWKVFRVVFVIMVLATLGYCSTFSY